MTKDPNDFKPKNKTQGKDLEKKYPPDRYVWKDGHLQYTVKNKPEKRRGTPPTKKRSVQKDIATVRKAIAKFSVDNAHKVEKWMERVAEEDPAKAIDLYTKLLEYHIPKLARVDSKVQHQGNVQFTVNTGIPAPPNSQVEHKPDEVIDVTPEKLDE